MLGVHSWSIACWAIRGRLALEIKCGNMKAQFDSYNQTYDATVNAAMAPELAPPIAC